MDGDEAQKAAHCEEPYVVGLPDEFDLTPELAAALDIDAIVAGCSLRHGLFEAAQALAAKAREAYESGDIARADALQLLATVTAMQMSDVPRVPFGHVMSGTDGNNRAWHTALPEHLGERHLAALGVMLDVVTTTSIRARLADVLWNALPKRNPAHGREAVAAYLSLADTTFDPSHWIVSEECFARAYQIARYLGPTNTEIGDVIAKGWAFLDRLNGNDPLYYTERIIRRLIDHFTNEQLEELLMRVTAIINCGGDVDRIRTYYDVAIRLTQKLERDGDIKALRIARADTYIAQASVAANETHRAIYLRDGRQALLDAGASPTRIAKVAAMLDQAQTLAVTEMERISTTLNTNDMTAFIRGVLAGRAPIEGLWRLAAVDIMTTREAAREAAEESVGQFHFLHGFGKSVKTHDGREQTRIPGSLEGPQGREAAIIGAMREIAARQRMVMAFGIVEPGRQYLLNSHAYTLAEIYEALRGRPLIPHEHQLLWSKGIHAGLVGEYDVAVHLLAPQIEHALRELLHRRGVINYTTRNNFQQVLSIEAVVAHEEFRKMFPDNYVFTLEGIMADRLGANVRNDVAHGLINDVRSNSHEAAYLWWFALRLLAAVGPHPLSTTATPPPAAEPQAPPEGASGEAAPSEEPPSSRV